MYKTYRRLSVVVGWVGVGERVHQTLNGFCSLTKNAYKLQFGEKLVCCFQIRRAIASLLLAVRGKGAARFDTSEKKEEKKERRRQKRKVNKNNIKIQFY